MIRNEEDITERRKSSIKEQIEATLKIEYLSKQLKDLSDFVKEHMKEEEAERHSMDRKLLIIAAIVVLDALIPGGGSAIIKALL